MGEMDAKIEDLYRRIEGTEQGLGALVSKVGDVDVSLRVLIARLEERWAVEGAPRANGNVTLGDLRVRDVLGLVGGGGALGMGGNWLLDLFLRGGGG